jgi:acylphosphatase
MSEPTITKRVLISGQVQGVGFRAWTQDEAELRGLSGWVRNRRDGSVEALFVGPSDLVAEMIETCRKGPRHARVEAVETIYGNDDPPTPGRFKILPTA